MEAESCLRATIATLSVEDVYELAGLIGTEVEKLIGTFGRPSVEGLIPQIVKVLELLEGFAVRRCKVSREEELLRALQDFQTRAAGKKEDPERELGNGDPDRCGRVSAVMLSQDLELKLTTWQKKAQDLEKQLSELKEENQQLLIQLGESQTQEDSELKKEREVMLKLKQVVDRQRDELRAQDHELKCRGRDVDALQEQLERFMKMNQELRHKLSISQTQLQSALQRRTEVETSLQLKEKELERMVDRLKEAQELNPGKAAPEIDLKPSPAVDPKDPNRPCFTKQEVRQIVHERNELKANLFLMQEELAYYQREILNDERCPVIFIEAIKTMIKKQRKKIKAKMLGIPEETCSSDDEVDGPLSSCQEIETDCVDSKLRVSRIKNIFGLWYRSSSKKEASSPPASAHGSWENLSSEELKESSDPTDVPE
ncbi:rab-interacting lysosomal protein isoform X2 [Latimeria chalumnae]|uniref:rab-interacting lysosomal protein isoform X2 n=1 Tax=Latimeria chalumnae TaxID=7897 RepID=UPI0003C147FB|nr:PREDICTED: rab-interacting lysosomal protein isoform X2 [Latimeria chalumnae]|eukprot:XP_006006159.1 PREDICTED: rab-interacting lysosomal protein isoform X2 [Latimeria chalumnae]